MMIHDFTRMAQILPGNERVTHTTCLGLQILRAEYGGNYA